MTINMKPYARINKVERVDIKTMRQKKGLSVRQISNKLKIDHRNYAQMEKGMRNMPHTTYDNFLKIVN